MIEAPLHSCRRHSWRTAATLLGLGISLLLPAMLMVFGVAVEGASESFVLNHHPTVFLRGDVGQAEVESLAAEIRQWPQAGAVTILAPDDNLKVLEERLGPEQVAGLKILPAMLPPSIEIEPAAGIAGHVDLVSRVAGLEARMEVDAVDVAHPAAMRSLSMASGVVSLGFVLMLLGIFAGWVITREYLRSLRRTEVAQEDLLELLGSSSFSLARPTLVRGAVVGGVSGVLASLVLAVLLVALQGLLTTMLGVEPALGSAWLFAFAPIVLGILSGLSAGLSVMRRVGSTLEIAGMQPYFLGSVG